jgi:DNA-binding transcriptional MerR regulator/SAM-dependent methyltransferase
VKNYRISELGRSFGLSRSALLYYDRVGLLRPRGRSGSGYRQYTEEDFARLERICFFREAGLSLEEIAQVLEGSGEKGSILEKRLRELGREAAVLRSRQRLIAGMLRTVAGGPEDSGLDRALWLDLQKACGLDEAALKVWHTEFERRAPAAHHDFLLGLGLSEKEAIQVRMLTKSVEANNVKMDYFFELFEELPRQGPGCREATLRALGALKDLPPKPRVLDIGCGSGMQTQLLARELGTRILAIDNHRPVLDRLARAAAEQGLDIETRELSMIDMPFGKDSFDLLWSEGSIFIIGLERGLKDFRTFLRPGGYLAFTEMCWFADDPLDDPPVEIKAYFDRVYPEIRSAEKVRRLAVAAGYQLIESFDLPDSAWWEDYYRPMLERIGELRVKNSGMPEAEALYAECKLEAEMFRLYSKHYGYTFFVLRKA